MDFERIYNKGQAQLFQNRFLESLTKTRPWVIYSLYIPLCIYLIYYSYTELKFSGIFIFTVFCIAMFSWTLFEYFAHRYLFHYEATSELGTLVFGLFYGLSFLLTGTGNYAFIYFPGFISGYLIYVSMHYAIHAFPPPRGMKSLWRNHHLHHYKYPERGFGVSSVFWDLVFGTRPTREGSDGKSG